ncbi:hypothetical protein BOO25_18650 [Vibrio navarrensis]|uniref:beta-sandwich lipoprotein n=1 Tax=Vibrio navarrensis TaxID=29495 RepID=UPI00192FB040|nr:hypothetical protein [Vibrio navarrensis]MBE3670950.1 hypothetical protein [Vibrio navarrensis]
MSFSKILILSTICVGLIVGCSDARQALSNNKKAAENFEINRELTFYNTITDTVMLQVQGYCSFEVETSKIDVVCKRKALSPKDALIDRYTMTRSDNSLMFQRQLEPSPTGLYNPRWILKPGALIPNVEVK